MTIQGVYGNDGKLERFPIPPHVKESNYGCHEATTPILDKNEKGKYYVVILKNKNNMGTEELKVTFKFKQKAFPFARHTNFVNTTDFSFIYKAPVFSGYNDSPFPISISPKLVAIRTDPRYPHIVFFKDYFGNGKFYNAKITFRFFSIDGRIGDYTYSLCGANGNIIDKIDLLPNMISFAKKGSVEDYKWGISGYEIDFSISKTTLGDPKFGHESNWLDYN